MSLIFMDIEISNIVTTVMVMIHVNTSREKVYAMLTAVNCIVN